MLISAIVFITAALIFYTVGVWSEKKAGILKPWHLILFWFGLACDTTGTALMGQLSGGSFQLNLHGVTGALAIILMIFHAIWGTIVLLKKAPKALKSFHQLSTFVWGVWLVPYVIGLIVGMGGKP